MHGGRSLESDFGKFQTLAIFSGILRFEAMPVSSQQHRAAIGSFVSFDGFHGWTNAESSGFTNSHSDSTVENKSLGRAIFNRTTGSGVATLSKTPDREKRGRLKHHQRRCVPVKVAG